LDKIATIGKKNAPQPATCVHMRGRQIIVMPYYWGLRKKRLLQSIYDNGIRIAAVDENAPLKNRSAMPVLTANGRLLKIALLPQILDQKKILWRQDTIGVNCDTLSGYMSALCLAQETRRIAITGKRAREVKDYLFRQYGLITDGEPASFDLESLSWQGDVIAKEQIISAALAEALLVAVSAERPAISPPYLFSLARRAAYYGFSLTKGEDRPL